jgi:hypothetical protein
MFILTIKDKETDGAYAVLDDDGDHILYLFEEEDDATRFAMMLEEQDFPEMHVIEVENKLMLKTCEIQNYRYTIITKDDIVIPPDHYDFI